MRFGGVIQPTHKKKLSKKKKNVAIKNRIKT